MTPCGFPHSEICGSKIICISPQLIAAYHVFHRLPVPRHSPCALFSLTVPIVFRRFQLFRFSICQQDSIKIVVLIVSHFAVSCYSVFKVHLRLAPHLPSTLSKCISALASPEVDCLYSAFASYKREQASQLFLPFREVVGSSGLEPPTSRLSGARSNHLSYEPILVEIRRLELLTPCLQSRCSPS